MTVDADVRSLLAGPNYAHLATLLPDGSPHSVPLWVDLEGDRVAFLTVVYQVEIDRAMAQDFA